MKPLECVRRCFRIAAPRIDDSAPAEVRLENPWVRFAQLDDCFEHLPLECAERRRLSGMQQPPYGFGQKSVGIEVVFFHVERRILPLEVARSITAHAMAENEVLCARR